jgi:TP901 family phage tail tape measure protein
MRPILESLKEFRALVVALDSTPTSRLTKEMQALKTGAISLTMDVEKALTGLPKILTQQVAAAASSAKTQMKEAGKVSAEAFADSAAMTMRAQRQRLQREYEQMVSMNAKFKPGVLENLKARGVDLGPNARGDAYSASLVSKSASTVDARTLLGLPARDEMKTTGAQIAAQLREGMVLESLRTKSASAVDPRMLLGLPGRDGMKTFGSQIAAQMREGVVSEGLRAKSASNIDPRTLLGLASDASNRSARSSMSAFMDAGLVPTQKMTSAQGALAESLRTTHSAARGLASGFNAMWLTWGQIGPLLAGAAISNAFVQAVKSGAQFEQSLAAIQFLGGESEQAVRSISEAALDLARNGPVGPLEIAAAFKTLSLAGLNAKEQLAAIKPVLNFSIAGEMDVNKAAESLAGISSAFGFDAKGFGAVGDVIAKSAAISMTSVESMTESFKQASTVAQLYGVTVQDVATSLVFLSQVGIKGTAAGTATRNMYNELMGSSKAARKVLQETLKIDVIDNATNSIKPLATILGDLSGALGKLDFKSQLAVLSKLGNERGLKALAADLAAFAKTAKDGGKDVATEFQRIQQLLNDAPGFAAEAAIGMGLTAQSQMKSVGATLQSSLIEAFQAMQPEILAVARTLREVFASDGFRTGLTEMISSIGSATRFLLEHIDVLKVVAAGYLLGKVASLAFAAGNALAAVSAGTLSAALSVAGVSAARASAGMALFSASMGPIALVITAATLAYLYFSDTTETASQKASKAVQEYSAATLEGYKKESARLQEQMDLRAQGIQGTYLAQIVEARATQTRLDNLYAEERAARSAETALLLVARARISGRIADTANPTAADVEALSRNDARILASQDREMTGSREEFKKREKISGARDTMLALAKKDSEQAAIAAKAARNATAGTGVYTPDSGGRGGGRGATAPFRDAKSGVDNVFEQYKIAAADSDRIAKAEEARLKFRYDMGLETFKTFEDEKDRIQKAHMQDRALMLTAEAAQAKEGMEKIKKAAETANRKKPGSVTDEAVQNNQEALRLKLTEANDGLKKLADEQARSDEASMLRKSKDIIATTQSAKEMVANAGLELDALRGQTAERMLLNGMLERDAAIEEGRQVARKKFLEEELKLSKAIREYRESGGDTEKLMQAEDTLANLRLAKPTYVNEAGKLKADEYDAKKLADTARELRGGIADAIMQGGAEGALSLRKVLEDTLIRKPLKIALEAAFDPMSQMLSSAASSVGSSLFSGVMGLFGARAGGGPVSEGNRYLVGENGPEIVEFGAAGKVHSNNESQRMAGAQQAGGTQMSISISPTIQIDARTDKAQIEAIVMGAMMQTQKSTFEELKKLGITR